MEKDKDTNAIILTRLAKFPEWEVYKKRLEIEIEARKRLCSKRIITQEELAEHNIMAGEIAGLFLALRLPDMIQESIKNTDIMNKYKEEHNGK